MTGTVSYFVDCASYQGTPDWAKVAAVCIGGAEKVTEGTGYVNPRWGAAKPAMKAAAAHGFVPLAYMFLDAVEPGASQAQHFASQAGDLAGFGIVVDYERAPNGAPTLQQAQDAAAKLRKLYPRHPLGGYAPHWYTGGENLGFCDWLWASEYVTGSGDPAVLYRQVPAAWWAPYGDRSPLMLQFTSQASVAGIAGLVDCSAFQGGAAQLASHVLQQPSPPPPAPVPPAASPARPGGDMLITLNPGDVPVTFPVWANAAGYKEPAAYSDCSLAFTGGSGAVLKATLYGPARPLVVTAALKDGEPWWVYPRPDWSAYTTIELQRLDTRKGVPASATFRTW